MKIHQNTSTYINIHQHTSKYIKIHQNTSKYIKIHQDTSKYIKIHQQILEYILDYILDSSPEICPSDLGKLYFPLFGPGKPHHLDAGRALLEAALQLAGKAPVKPMMALDFG